jgi:hypothetical protein
MFAHSSHAEESDGLSAAAFCEYTVRNDTWPMACNVARVTRQRATAFFVTARRQ